MGRCNLTPARLAALGADPTLEEDDRETYNLKKKHGALVSAERKTGTKRKKAVDNNR